MTTLNTIIEEDTPDTEWEKELEQHAPNLTFKSLDNGVNTISMVWLKSFIRTTLTSRDTYWKERVEEARKEAYAHAEIVRQRTLNDIREAVEADVPYGGAKDCVYVILDNLK